MLSTQEKSLQAEAFKADINKRKLFDGIFIIVGILCISIALLVLLSLILSMAIDGLPRLTPDFFMSFPSRKPEQAGILSAWVGSVLIILVTALVSIPIGIASAIYLEEYARKNWISTIIEINVTNLAGVPSIVYGLLALGFFVYQFNFGRTILTGGLTLALLILPVTIVTTREALRAVPNSIREGSYAVGASRWQMIWDQVLPCSVGSILTGIIIGLSRAIGETAPLVTIGALTFIAFLPDSPLDPTFPFLPFRENPPFFDFEQFFRWLTAPFTVMPIQMYNWVSRPQEEFHVNAAAAGTVLLMMSLLMNSLAIYLRYRFRKGMQW